MTRGLMEERGGENVTTVHGHFACMHFPRTKCIDRLLRPYVCIVRLTRPCSIG